MNVMRIEAGPHRVTTTDGEVLCVDHPLSVSQADVLQRAITSSGLSAAVVFAIEVSEGGTFVEHLRPDWKEVVARDSDAQIYERSAVCPTGRGVAISTILPNP